jgi:preprotein translocase subunit Sss1
MDEFASWSQQNDAHPQPLIAKKRRVKKLTTKTPRHQEYREYRKINGKGMKTPRRED